MKLITMRELLEGGFVPWESERTTRRKILEENFPAIKIKNRFYFDLEKVKLWFKRHEFKAS